MRSSLRLSLISLYNLDAVGLRYISSVLRQEGHTVDMVFFKEPTFTDPIKQYRIVPAITRMSEPKSEEIEALVETVRHLDSDLIGISLNCSSLYRIAAEVSRVLKEVVQAPVVWGGVHPTLQPEECFHHADVVCRGEGEIPMRALVNALSAEDDIIEIPNLWVKRGERLYKNDTQPPVQDIDSLPFPDHDPESKHYISVSNPSASEETYAVVTARGCPFSCSYCCNHILHKVNGGSPVRQRSVENVIAELMKAKRSGCMKTVRIFDDIFGLDRKWTEEFAQQYKRHIDLPLGFNVHPNTVKKGNLNPLKSLSFVDVTMGIQSGSEEVREILYNRFTSDESIIQAGTVLHETGFFCAYDIITDNPYESEEDTRKTIDLLLTLPRPFMLSITSLAFFPSTEITEKALRDGMITPSMIEGKSEKVTHEWLVSTEYPRSREQRYYIMLMAATQYDSIPKWLIRFLKGSTVKIPQLLYLILKAAIFFTRMGRRSLYRDMEDTLLSKMGGESHGHLR